MNELLRMTDVHLLVTLWNNYGRRSNRELCPINCFKKLSTIFKNILSKNIYNIYLRSLSKFTYLGTRTASAWQFSSGWSSHSSCGTFCTCILTSSRQTCSPCCIAQLLGTQTSLGIFRHSVSGCTFRTVFLVSVHFCTGHSSQFSSTYNDWIRLGSLYGFRSKSKEIEEEK